MKETMICIVDNHHGVYIPQTFAEWYGYGSPDGELFKGRTLSLQDTVILKAGPDHPDYWDYWAAILDEWCWTDADGVRWSLYQDMDLFMVSEHHVFDDE